MGIASRSPVETLCDAAGETETSDDAGRNLVQLVVPRTDQTPCHTPQPAPHRAAGADRRAGGRRRRRLGRPLRTTGGGAAPARRRRCPGAHHLGGTEAGFHRSRGQDAPGIADRCRHHRARWRRRHLRARHADRGVQLPDRPGLPPTGEVDAATLGALNAAPAARPRRRRRWRSGTQSPEVKALQEALIRFGVYLPKGANGIFDASTQRGIRNFQVVERSAGERCARSGDDGSSRRRRTGAAPAAAVTPAANPSVGLRMGSQGSLVKALQQALINAGITLKGGADGSFGAATKAALVSYQNANGLSASGTVDEATAAKLGLGGAAPAPAPTASANPYAGLEAGRTGRSRQGPAAGADQHRTRAARRGRRFVRCGDEVGPDPLPEGQRHRADRCAHRSRGRRARPHAGRTRRHRRRSPTRSATPCTANAATG